MRRTGAWLLLFMSIAALVAVPVSSGLQAQEPAPATRKIGAIKTIQGNTIILTADAGTDLTVSVQDSTKLLKIAPGEKNLKNATPVQLQELQVGDRILAAGKLSDDGRILAASSVVVMKRSDVEAHKQEDLQDWQKRGVSGPVTAVDQAAGTVSISVTGFGGKKPVIVRTSKQTVIRRYAPDSVKFDDAKPGTLQEIHQGDQLRARGERNSDGGEISAEEIVSGSFRNLAGLVNSVDAGASTISVQDLTTKKPVQVKVTAESQLHKLPPEMAQRLAMRLKMAEAGQTMGGPGMVGNGAPRPGNGEAHPDGAPGGPGGFAGMRGGAPDPQQMLNRTPVVALTDLHKGDAVMVLATSGTEETGSSVITLLAGVEPILQAAPNSGQEVMFGSWNIGGPSGDTGNQ